MLEFRCNICGSRSEAPRTAIERETPSCRCGSTLRWRSVVHLLSLALFGRSVALPDMPENRAIRGIGMSDWPGYAGLLAAKFDYANTFLERDPQLDITVFNPKLENQLDFILSSDVFEHVPPPVSVAFENSRRMLRSGGVLVLTVPFSTEASTVEHFPELYHSRIETRDGWRVLVNLTRDGRRQEFPDLIFHGDTASDDGSLELRVFSESGVVEHLRAAGFTDVRIHSEPELAHGIERDGPWSLPISARVP